MVKYFKRSLDSDLDAWVCSASRKPLILRGARQVGKTIAIREMAKRNGLNLVELNFEQFNSLSKLFENDIVPDVILAQIELFKAERIVPGQTLLFLDEIQVCPRAITALRYFYE